MKTKKLLAVALALVTILSCVSFTAFADEPTTTTIKYLEPTYKDDDYTKGLSGWEVVEKEDVTIATSETDFSAGGWYAVTSNLDISSNITVTADLNLYIAKNVKLDFSYHSLTVSDKTVTLYGEGTFDCDNVTVGTLIVNGVNMAMSAPQGQKEDLQKGHTGANAITGNAIFNAGGGYINGGKGGETDLDDATGGDGGCCVTGSLYINGADELALSGGEGTSGKGKSGDSGNVAVDMAKVHWNEDVTMSNQQYVSYCCAGYPNTFTSSKFYLIPDNTDTTKGTLVGGSAAKDGKITATYTTETDYLVSKLYADGVEITKNSEGKYEYTMPAHNVILTADFVDGCYLDLDETDHTYLKSKDIDQNYTFKQTGATTYNDVSKVKLEWTVTDIAATYTSSKTWDPDTMSWTETKGDITGLDDHTATFKLTNYSSTKVAATVTFAAETALKDSLEDATFKNGDTDITDKNVILDTAVKADKTVDSSKTGANAPSKTITATLEFDQTEFAKLSEQKTAATYGTYTVTIKHVYAISIEYGNSVESHITPKAENPMFLAEGDSVELEFDWQYDNLEYIPTLSSYKNATAAGQRTEEDGSNGTCKFTVTVSNPTGDVTITINKSVNA